LVSLVLAQQITPYLYHNGQFLSSSSFPLWSLRRVFPIAKSIDNLTHQQGALFAMAMYTFFMNYAYNSPFKDLVPPMSDLWQNPTYFFAAWKNVIELHEKDKAVKAVEHRTRYLDDVAKRKYYMKAHGIETKDPVAMVFGKDEGKSEEELEAVALGHELSPSSGSDDKPEHKKKWLGIW
jgi:hypothetical protein